MTQGEAEGDSKILSIRDARDVCNLRIFHLNIQSLTPKVDELLLYAQSVEPRVICVSEHWCGGDDILALNFPGYTVAAHFGRKTHLHGGTAILVAQNLRYKTYSKLENLNREMEVEFCGIELCDFETIIVCVYRPSSSRNFGVFFDVFDMLVASLTTKNREICILGDFNIDLVNDPASITGPFRDIISSYNLRIGNNEPTRGLRCLDNVFTTYLENTYKCDVVDPLLSDHLGLIFDVTLKLPGGFPLGSPGIQGGLQRGIWTDLLSC